MTNLLKKYARCKRHNEHNNNKPKARTIYGLALSDHFTHINTYKEDRDTAPEYFQMAYSMMNRRNPLH